MNVFILVEGRTENAEKMQIEYYKNRNNIATESTHLMGMIERFEQTGHIVTFGNLLNFCEKLNKLDK